MITIDDLKSAPILQGLPDAVFTKLLEIAEAQTVKEGEVIYDSDSEADNVYLLKHGKVLMETDLKPGVTVSLASIKPGYIFGWYGMVPSTSHSMRARAVADSDLVVLPGDDLRMLMDENHDFGYQFMNKMYLLLKDRLDRRTDQLAKVLARHPDLHQPGE